MLTVNTQISPPDDLAQLRTLLTSVRFADEINIYNFGRSDAAFQKLAKDYSAKIINLDKPYPKIVEVIRAREIKESKGDWVLILDYDELVPEALAQEIMQVCRSSTPNFGAYMIPRRNYSLGFPLRYGGFGDDYIHRLFHRPSFIDWPTNIHSTPTFRGNLGKLTNYLVHHKDASLSQMVEKTNRYSDIEAQQFFSGGLPPVTPFTLIRKSSMEFIRRYLLKKGFLDGRIGLIQSLYQSYSVFITYAKLFELQRHSHE